MEQVKEKLIEHDFAINAMVKSIQELSDTTKDSNVKLGDIARSMGKQELILEELANLGGNTKDSMNRVHKRIDKVEKQAEDNRNKMEIIDIANTSQEANIKSNQKRLDKLDASQSWVVRTIIGALTSGALATLFILARG
jgi:chromosome condensin MukBEF ATPase and DNA-binding subunit MukB